MTFTKCRHWILSGPFLRDPDICYLHLSRISISNAAILFVDRYCALTVCLFRPAHRPLNKNTYHKRRIFMEITKEFKQDLSELESVCSSFLGKYESQLTAALNKAEMSAEESLKIDLMLELITHLSSAQFVSSYMQKEIVKEGILLQDKAGNFTLGGTPLPPMSDVEVYVHDDELDQDVWKRVFIGGGSEKRICGLRHPDLTSGVHARIRG